ncbi:TonB-dependent receptor [Salidesulfovibrio onnuriiensis]|uniref:TonB-dependent receptor n=1 Tax=Salidesulfovibrio onnuriiensis TaxID=2583823 RepID=UPI0011CC28A5|nr:TonB-dependent receptor [Salidesulfovibrio onnuriiensis]
MKRISGFLALLAAVMLLSPVCGYAEEKKEVTIETMTVTAQKTGQDIQDVPVGVSAFSDVDLDEHGIGGFHDLIDQVPNLFIRKNSADNAIVIRGISSFAGSLYSTAGFYVDGVNYPIHQMQDMDFMDIERVEVLKGPQGTLYGRNSQAGVVNIITKQPGNEFSAKAFTDIGMWDANGGKLIFKEGFSANLPLVDEKLSMRISAQKEDSNGWMRNVYKDTDAKETDHLSGRMTTRWTPSDDLGISFMVEGRKKHDGLGVYRYTDGPYATKRNELAWNGGNRNTVEANAQMLKVEYAGEMFDITSVTGRHSYTQDFINDMDLSTQNFGPGFEDSYGSYDIGVWSEELRFASKEEKGRAIDWLAGVYGYVEDADTVYYGYGLHDTEQDNWGAAAFGQGTWNITPAWHFTLGSRLDYVRLEGKKDLDLSSVGGGTSVLEGKIHSTEFLPSASLAYDLSDDVMTYVRVSRGYLAGGFDYSTSTTQEQFMFKPEYSWNYELGLKSTLLDRKLTANLATFYIDITDKQVAQLEPTIPNPENRRIVNAARAESYGAELEMQYKPVQALLLTSSLGYLNSRLRDWTTVDDPFDYDGKKTPGSPDWTYSVGGTYRWESGFFAGVDVTGVSSFYTDPKNTSKVDGRTLVNPRVGYEGDNFDVVLWAKNVFDEEYNENEWSWGGSTLVQQGAPRSFGLKTTCYF